MKKLKGELEKNKEIRNYRIFIKEERQLSVGAKGNILGGPYNPLSFGSSVTGQLHIEWKSGNVSFVNITSWGLENPAKLIKKSKKLSYTDKFAKGFVEPWEQEDKMEQYSKDVVKVIDADQSYLAEQAAKLMEIEVEMDIEKHDLGVSVSETVSKVANSKGLELKQSFTKFMLSSEWDMKVGFYIQKRKLFDILNYKDRIQFLDKLFKAANKKVERRSKEDNSIKVIIDPYQTWNIFDHFVFSNLNGEYIANGLSRFGASDFENERKVLPSWLDLEVDPEKPLTPGASSFTSEGVRTKKVVFIEKGKLKQPIVDLKHAQKMDLKPSIGISSPYTTSILSNNNTTEKLEKEISETQRGLFIPYFLGMHTQNSLTGDYSLPVPHGILIEDGKLKGAKKAVVTGNFYRDLSGEVSFIDDGILPFPGICYTPNVDFE